MINNSLTDTLVPQNLFIFKQVNEYIIRITPTLNHDGTESREIPLRSLARYTPTRNSPTLLHTLHFSGSEYRLEICFFIFPKAILGTGINFCKIL